MQLDVKCSGIYIKRLPVIYEQLFHDLVLRKLSEATIYAVHCVHSASSSTAF